ncbi:MAG TPA: tetratricopeptide repeat protein, partial [Ilumatobacteraceae bacterium]|nr:tetratricopeptide repeat protein [Ilumatobacteraceae bacterium]
EMELSDAERAHSLFLRAFVAGSHDDRITARAMLHEALALSEATSSWLHLRMLRDEAWYDIEDGDLDRGEVIARQVIELAGPAHDGLSTSRALTLLAQISHMRGDHEVAVGYLDAALDITTDSGDLENEVLVTSHLGIAHHLIADNTRSVDHYERACELYDRAALQALELGLTRIAAVTWCNLAQARLRLDDAEGCRGALRRAAPLVGLSSETFEPRLYVLVEADLRVTTGDVESGLEFLGAVKNDPWLPASDRQEIDRILSRLDLPPERIAAGMEAGARRGFDDVAQSLLGGE